MEEIAIMLADDPEAARLEIAANREAQEAKFAEDQKRRSLKQFGQLQTMKLAASKVKDSKSPQAKDLQDRIKQTIGALSRNEFFPHKDLLDGSQPVYVGSDGTVVQKGDHVRKDDGSVMKVLDFDLTSNKMTAQEVSGPDYNPLRINDDAKQISLKNINARGVGAVRPTEWNDSMHEARVVGRVTTYGELKNLSPEQIARHRDTLEGQIKNSGYERVPYEKADGSIAFGYARDMADGDRILMPGDEQAYDKLLQGMAADSSSSNYKYRDAAEILTGRPYYGRDGIQDEVESRIKQIREENQPPEEPKQSTPQETSQPATAQTKPASVEAQPSAKHPDPIGHIKDMILQIDNNDGDRGQERNDMGWSAFTREFGSSLAQQIKSGRELSPAQLRHAQKMLSRSHRPQAGNMPTEAELETALGTQSKPKIRVDSVKRTIHAKKGHELHVVPLIDRVDRDKYDHLANVAKKIDAGAGAGYYSSYNKQGAIPGFQFMNREHADQFADYASSLEKSVTVYRLGNHRYEWDGSARVLRKLAG
jgi:hypothetical protein